METDFIPAESNEPLSIIFNAESSVTVTDSKEQQNESFISSLGIEIDIRSDDLKQFFQSSLA